MRHSCFRGTAVSDDIASKVIEIVAEELGHKVENVTEDSKFVDDLGADSLDTVELVMRLEEEFECEIPDDEAEKIATVGAAIEFVRKSAAQPD